MLENPTEWKVMRLFCKRPTKSFFVKEIARELKISPSSSSTICKKLAKEGVLLKKIMGNLVLYKLDNQSFLARGIKRLVFLFELQQYKSLFEDEEYQSVMLYGSYSNGEHIEKSDIDLLVITNVEEKKVRERLMPVKKLGDVMTTVLPVSGWMEMKEKGDPFYKEVAANHTLLYGEKLAI